MATAKQAAQQVLDHLPEQVSWERLLYELYVTQRIEAGMQAAREGRTVPHQEAKRRLLGDDAD